MAVTIVRAADLVRTPWKNGGGTTAEIAAAPSGASFDAFDWRLSMADVGVDGPFSTFPGIDRTLTLIEGAGIDLDIDGTVHRLDPGIRSVSFPGEANASARLPDGPIRDFNVMTRRGRFTHRMGVEALAQPGDILAVVAMDASATVQVDGQEYALARLDTMIIDPWPTILHVSGAVLSTVLTRL